MISIIPSVAVAIVDCTTVYCVVIAVSNVGVHGASVDVRVNVVNISSDVVGVSYFVVVVYGSGVVTCARVCCIGRDAMRVVCDIGVVAGVGIDDAIVAVAIVGRVDDVIE